MCFPAYDEDGFFSGDFVDTGSLILEISNVVIRMIEKGSALSIMRYQEYNYVSFYAPA